MGTWLRSGPFLLLQTVMPTFLLGYLDNQTFYYTKFLSGGIPGDI